jgi:hypothetical protein
LVATAAGVTLQSVSLDLPTSDRSFPGGGAADAINNNCLSCHSAGMVLNQPVLSRAARQAIVDKMRGTVQGADRSQGCRPDRQLSRRHQAP